MWGSVPISNTRATVEDCKIREKSVEKSSKYMCILIILQPFFVTKLRYWLLYMWRISYVYICTDIYVCMYICILIRVYPAAEVLATQRARSSTHLVAPLRHNANGSGSQLRVCSENANFNEMPLTVVWKLGLFHLRKKKNSSKKKKVFWQYSLIFLRSLFVHDSNWSILKKKNTKPQIWTATAAHGVPWPYSGSHRKDRPRGCWTLFRGLGWRRKNAGSQILQAKIPIVEPTWRRTTMRRKKMSWGGGGVHYW